MGAGETVSKPLPRRFYRGDPMSVARQLLGARLVRVVDGAVVSGMIVETEAYYGTEDSACHAFKGMTPRTEVMFGNSGHAYVYFIYGMYHMLNVVTGPVGTPWAVLVRGIRPLDNFEKMVELRGGRKKGIADGPGKLCIAMVIDKSLNGWDLTTGDTLWIERYESIPDEHVEKTPRIGIDYAHPEHRALDWRFLVRARA